MKKFVLIGLGAALAACAPMVNLRGGEIPLAPYGMAWKITIEENGTSTNETYRAAGKAVVSFEELKPTSSSGGISTYVAPPVFQSGNLSLYGISLNVGRRGQLTELSATAKTALAFAWQSASSTGLDFYPDNKKTLFQQTRCVFSSFKPEAVLLNGLAFRETEIKDGTSTRFKVDKVGTCALEVIDPNPGKP